MNVPMMKSMFLRAMARDCTLFSDYDDSHESIIRVTYNGDNLSEINVYVSFSLMDDGTMMANVGNYDLPNFSSNLAAGYKACNKANDDEMIKFYIDDDCDAVTQVTLIFNGYGISHDFSAEQVLCAAVQTALAVDSAYPMFQSAKWA